MANQFSAPDLKMIGEAISSRMMEIGKSFSGLSKEMNALGFDTYNAETVSRVVHGTRKIAIVEVEALCMILGMEMRTLLAETEALSDIQNSGVSIQELSSTIERKIQILSNAAISTTLDKVFKLQKRIENDQEMISHLLLSIVNDSSIPGKEN